MSYKLILAEEAERDLLLWKKSGQKKDLLKILSLFKNTQLQERGK